MNFLDELLEKFTLPNIEIVKDDELDCDEISEDLQFFAEDLELC